ncbi:PREDICTED: zingipain-2-like isoform X1 [Nicotiana attenuata]|uniref:Senescence-specific cysteine protease sag39 n=1 Tax=Nicotiana attenuata TaxID=49451 RepID=A0A314KTR1_NICAT|nr:PREDICTED: zingipain-2-like isoform X1 [Nicotiana attenuata]XP_019225386.1 PREDICTED: zingipain-2-like isoform X1 [Nicotiana attenuata]OIT32702.1 senescence-specific cysteine protease sag39 [Nicotiana attenuata]
MALVLGWKILFILLFVMIGMCTSQVTSRNIKELSMLEKHELWMANHGRTYKNEEEKEKRLNIFKENVKFIESFNNNGTKKPYKLGINVFADLTAEEFLSYYTTGIKLSNSYSQIQSSFKYENLSDVPSVMDWRRSGAVTRIKHQGQCGCCWAFSAVAALEGANKLSTGNLISLSEQQLLDCTTENNGCDGGLMTTAYDFIIKNGGIATESNYPYEEYQDSCKSQEIMNSAVKISRYETLPSTESALLKAVAKQPVSIGVAVNEEFHLYQSGVYNGNCEGQELNHAVTVIGYGIENNGTKYWLIKNSWGSSWGENGYMKIARDTGIEGGLCGITTLASYPVL